MITIKSNKLNKEESLFFKELEYLTGSPVVCALYNNMAGPQINKWPALNTVLTDEQVMDINQSISMFRLQKAINENQEFTISWQ